MRTSADQSFETILHSHPKHYKRSASFRLKKLIFDINCFYTFSIRCYTLSSSHIAIILKFGSIKSSNLTPHINMNNVLWENMIYFVPVDLNCESLVNICAICTCDFVVLDADWNIKADIHLSSFCVLLGYVLAHVGCIDLNSNFKLDFISHNQYVAFMPKSFTKQ